MLKFKELYNTKIKADLQESFNYSNIMEIPCIKHVSLNCGFRENSEAIASNIAKISGQKPVIRKAKKSIASFNLRENTPVGCSVKLRKDNAYRFLSILVMVVLPRIRDFRGFSIKNFDGRGNLSFGLKDLTAFPEIHYDDNNSGLNVTIVTSANTNEEAKELLKGFNFPFIKELVG